MNEGGFDSSAEKYLHLPVVVESNDDFGRGGSNNWIVDSHKQFMQMKNGTNDEQMMMGMNEDLHDIVVNKGT